jgi:hypothetical protein
MSGLSFFHTKGKQQDEIRGDLGVLGNAEMRVFFFLLLMATRSTFYYSRKRKKILHIVFFGGSPRPSVPVCQSHVLQLGRPPTEYQAVWSLVIVP